MLLYGTCVSGFYRFKAFLLTVTTVQAHHEFSLEVLCQNKRKPQIDGLFQNVLHILGQEKYSSLRTRLLHATACRGYHEFNKKPGYYINKF